MLEDEYPGCPVHPNHEWVCGPCEASALALIQKLDERDYRILAGGPVPPRPPANTRWGRFLRVLGVGLLS